MRQLYVAGIGMFLVLTLLLTLLVLRYTGVFDRTVPITAVMKTVGDGLQNKADVKYRGMLVGEVEKVETVDRGAFQNVTINLKPEYADSIPSNVTARTVPSNVFAVNSIELLAPENPASQGLEDGAEVFADESAETTALQSTVNDLNEILTAIQPERLGTILGAISGGLDPSGRVPGSSLERLDRFLEVVDTGTPTGDDLLSRTGNAFAALNVSAPELVTMLESTVQTSLTLVEKELQFQDLLFAGTFATDSTDALFARNPNVGKVLASGGASAFGALTNDEKSIRESIPAFNNALRGVLGSFKNKPYYGQPYSNLLVNASFTPFYPYARVHCPRYGELAGPSCATAPIKADPGYLPKEMWPKALVDNMPPGSSGAPGLKHPFDLDTQGPPPPVKPFKPDKEDKGPADPPFPVPHLPFWEPVHEPKKNDKPASFTPSGAYTGPAAVAALLGRAPTTLEYLLLENALQGGVIEFTPAEEGAV